MNRDEEVINVSYTNWRGETQVRRVLLGQVRFGKTDWHEEPTWLISAFDLDHPAQIWKEFDLAKCDFNREYMGEVKRLRGMLEANDINPDGEYIAKGGLRVDAPSSRKVADF